MASKVRPLKAGILIAQLKDRYGVSLKEADLQKPSSTIMKRVFEAFITNYAGFARLDQLQVLEDVASQELVNIQIHRDAVQNILFHGAVSIFMRRAGVDNFSLKDIYNPDPSRTLLVLTCAMNYMKYKFKNEGKYLNVANGRLGPIFAGMNSLKEEVTEMELFVSNSRVQKENDKPVLDHWDEEMKELATEGMGLQVQRQSIQDENDSFQQDLNALEEQVSQVKVAVTNRKEEALELRRQIVESPEKMQRNLEELSENISKAEEQKDELKKGISTMGQKKGNLAKAARKVVKVKQLLDDGERELQGQKEMRLKVKETEDEREGLGRGLSLLQEKQGSAFQAVSAKSEQLQECCRDYVMREAAAHKNLDEAKAERTNVLHGQTEHERDVCNKENQLKAMEKMERAAMVKHNKRKARREHLCEDLLSAVQLRRQTLLNVRRQSPQMLSTAASSCSNVLKVLL